MVGGGVTLVGAAAAFSIDRIRSLGRKGPTSKSTRHPGGRHRCISRNAAKKPCRNKVEYEGERCRECWESLAMSPNAGVRAQLALKPDMPIDIFRGLVEDPDSGVRRRAAQRSWLCCPSDEEHRSRETHDPGAVPADALLAMLEEPEPEDDVFVMAELARNRRLPVAGQWILLEAPEIETLRCLASNEALDGEVAERLIRCPDDQQVREWAEARLDELDTEQRVGR